MEEEREKEPARETFRKARAEEEDESGEREHIIAEKPMVKI